MTDVPLGDLVERVADLARRRSGRTIGVDADESIVHGRAGAIERAVTNLVDNALKFDPAPSHAIEVEVRAGRVEVADRGPGIATSDLVHVFDRFYRAPDARRQPGSGLGLSIVREVAEGHGGTAFAANRPGGGACIGFTLPTA